jgi:hypothetical protein
MVITQIKYIMQIFFSIDSKQVSWKYKSEDIILDFHPFHRE